MALASPRNSTSLPYTASCRFAVAMGAIAAAVVAAVGCRHQAFDRIDREVDALIAATTGEVGQRDGLADAWAWTQPLDTTVDRHDPAARETPSTDNPDADRLDFTGATDFDMETDEVIARLESYSSEPTDAVTLDLRGALAYAAAHSRDFRFAEEEYVIAALRLLIERHRWGPRFFNDTTASIAGFGDAGLYDTSLDLVNEFSVTQRLPYGGSVSARALARATEDLHQRVAGENVQDAELILEANIPLLRGAGLAAREDLIQRSRDIIYAARDFEDFRREFLVDVAGDFLQLVVDLKSIESAERQVEGLTRQERRQIDRAAAGREPPFEAALAQNATIRARDNLNQLRERYRVSVDQFKVRIGMGVEQPLVIIESRIGLPIPKADVRDAVRAALAFRLDLQTSRDRIDDAKRSVSNARNDLLPDFDISASASIPTDSTRDRAGLRFDPEDADYRASAEFSLPLDREIERLTLREAQIRFERQVRSYDRLRDTIAVDVRAAVRSIDAALFSLQIQERGIEIAELRKAALEADPAAATARDFTEAEEALLDARVSRDRAVRALEVAVLQYLLTTGQLRVAPDGNIRPLSGMQMMSGEPQSSTIGREAESEEDIERSQPGA